MLDLALQSELQAEFKSTFVKAPKAEYSAEMLSRRTSCPGISDGGAHAKFFIGGAYPTDLIRWLVKEEGLLTLEQVHQKLSYPARTGRRAARPRRHPRVGFPADIVVYDLEELRPDPDFATSRRTTCPAATGGASSAPSAIAGRSSNGEVTFEDGKPTGATSGRLLRGGRG